MKSLDRYVLRELIVPFLIGTVAVTLMFQINTLMFLQKTYNLQGVPAAAILQILLFHTPEFLNMTLPVGMSLAASLTISRLARESELTAMRGAGASLRRILAPVAVFGALVSVASFYMVDRVMPIAGRRAAQVERDVFFLAASPVFKSNVALTLDKYAAFIGSVSRGADDSIALTNICLIEAPRPDEVWIYKAATGSYRDGDWLLRDASFYQLKGTGLVVAKTPKPVHIYEKIAISDFFSQPQPKDLSSAELLQSIRSGKAAGIQTQLLEIEYQTRFSVPCACLIFALVAPVFAIAFARTGGFIGVLLSIVLSFAYYNVYVVTTEILGRNATISPIVAAWLPNAIFVILGAVALRRLE